jgi:hypothetical protein
MGIYLIFIPASQTGELQTLDALVFGELKSKGAAMWMRQYTKDLHQKFNTQTSSVNLQEC